MATQLNYPDIAHALDQLLVVGEVTVQEHKKALQVAWEQDVAVTELLEDVAIDDPDEYARDLVAYVRRQGDEF